MSSAADRPAGPLQELTELRGELLRLAPAAPGEQRLRALLSEREADLRRKDEELAEARRALAEATGAKRGLETELREAHAELAEVRRELREAAGAARAIRRLLRQLSGEADLEDYERQFGEVAGQCRKEEVPVDKPRHDPWVEVSTVRTLLTTELELLERQMAAIAGQNQALEMQIFKQEPVPEYLEADRTDDAPEDGHHLDAFQAACRSFAARARVLARHGRQAPESQPRRAKITSNGFGH
mmetsp:Transcript_664/g.2084  ORF Transcript_664/g.2084 Transcript_664/m.2084 type:complete len:242 (+) Transcript_664:74-799(+)